jgi:hypothetical protein
MAHTYIYIYIYIYTKRRLSTQSRYLHTYNCQDHLLKFKHEQYTSQLKVMPLYIQPHMWFDYIKNTYIFTCTYPRQSQQPTAKLGISAPFQSNRISSMPLWWWEPNCGPPTMRLHRTTEGEKLKSNVLQQDNWPVNKSDLVNKYKNISFSS